MAGGLGALKKNPSLMSSSRAATPAGRSRKPGSRTRAPAKAKPAPKAKPKAATKPKATPKSKSKTATKPKPKTRTRSTTKPKAAPRRKPVARRAAPKRRRAAPKRTIPRRSPIAWTRDLIGGVSWRYRLGILAVLAVTAAAGYFLWLRDSSLVAIDNVDVVGVTSGDRAEIVGQLTDASESMTTLNVDRSSLESIAAQFPTVASISIDPNFPHGMRIEVTERPPTMVVDSGGGHQVPVAADGTLLTGVAVSEDDHLPVLDVDEPPQGTALAGIELDEALVVGAAPAELRPLIEKIGNSKEYGVEVTLRGGIPVRFGNGQAAAEKWSAAAAVLADPKLDTLSYLDVRVPERPAVGGAGAGTVSTEPPA
jgi:cell division protein FtsQ